MKQTLKNVEQIFYIFKDRLFLNPTNHVVHPDVPTNCMIRVLLPASPTIPKPWLVVEHNQTVAEHDRVEGEPPSSLTKFSHSGWHISFPSVSEPSFNLKKQIISI